MKTIKFVELIVWILLFVFLISIMVLFVLGKINFSGFVRGGKQIKLLQQTVKADDISDIRIDMSSAEVIINPSETDEILVTYRGPESLKNKLDLTVSVKGGELTIEQSTTRQFFFMNWWSLTSRVLEISLPESYSGDLVIANSSGDLTVSGEYKLAEFTSSLTSGDCRLEKIACSDFKIVSTSGNVTLGSIEADELDISLTSGRIEAGILSGDGSVESVSGGVSIDELDGKYRLSTTSGDIDVSAFSGSGSVSCSSGDIDIGVIESQGDLTIKAISGSVDVSLGKDTAYLIKANCTSGNVSANFPMDFSDDRDSAAGQSGNNPQSHLDVQTTSGDIDLAA